MTVTGTDSTPSVIYLAFFDPEALQPVTRVAKPSGLLRAWLDAEQVAHKKIRAPPFAVGGFGRTVA